MPIDSSAVKLVYRVRSERLSNRFVAFFLPLVITTNIYLKITCSRVKITDRALVLAMLGIFVMVVDAEITGQKMFGITKVSFITAYNLLVEGKSWEQSLN